MMTEGDNGCCSKYLFTLFGAAFGFRIFIALILHLWLSAVYPGNPYWQFGADGGDELYFFEDAERYATAWQNGTICNVVPEWRAVPFWAWSHIIGFIRFVGMSLGGDTLFNSKLIACFFGALLVPYIYLFTLRVYDVKTARRAAALALWLPDYCYLSASVLRDVAISCIGVIFFYQIFAGCRERFIPWRIFVASCMICIMLYMRAYFAIVLTILALIFLVWERGSNIKWAVQGGIVGGIIISILLILPQSRALVITKTMWLFNTQRLLRKVEIVRTESIEQAAGSSLGARVLSLPTPVRIPLTAGYLLVPIPPWGSVQSLGFTPRAIALSISAAVWLFLVVFLPTGFMIALSYKTSATVWIWGTSLCIVLSLSLSASIIPRWRLMVMPFLLILIALGLQSRCYYKLTLFSAVSAFCLLVLYCFLKYL